MNASNKPYVGGQAVLEGVMMRSPRSLAVAVRRRAGEIVVREAPWISIWERLKFLRWPFFRGTVVLAESMYNGIQALNFSAQQASLDDNSKPATKAETGGSLAVAFVLAISLFIGLPHLLAYGTGKVSGAELDVDSFAFHLLDGIFKMAIFIGYIAAVSLLPDMRRVFQYHGAEHKVVNTYENGQELTVENAKKFTTFHARCGTSFVLFVLALSVFMFAGVLPFVPRVAENAILNHLAMIVIKVPLMLPLAGIAYEINRFASNHPDQLWVQLIVWPGRLMQKLTTREPSDDQLEIALAAMRAALEREAQLADVDVTAARAVAENQPAGDQVVVFRNYAEIQNHVRAVGRS